MQIAIAIIANVNYLE